MTTLYEGAFAKLNLTLDVLGKREDGYHDLKSVMQTVSVRDDIEIDVDGNRKTLPHRTGYTPRRHHLDHYLQHGIGRIRTFAQSAFQA